VPDYGWRVQRVDPHSVAGRVRPPFVPLLDFIIAINGVAVEYDPGLLLHALYPPDEEIVSLDVFNNVTQTVRTVQFKSRPKSKDHVVGLGLCWAPTWSNLDGLAAALAQAKLQSNAPSSTDNVSPPLPAGIRVLEVEPGSVAEQVGLRPMRDWLLGTFSGQAFTDLDDLTRALASTSAAASSLNESVSDSNHATTKDSDENIYIYVYSVPDNTSDAPTVRLISIAPARVGPQGLGATVAFGGEHCILAPHLVANGLMSRPNDPIIPESMSPSNMHAAFVRFNPLECWKLATNWSESSSAQSQTSESQDTSQRLAQQADSHNEGSAVPSNPVASPGEQTSTPSEFTFPLPEDQLVEELASTISESLSPVEPPASEDSAVDEIVHALETSLSIPLKPAQEDHAQANAGPSRITDPQLPTVQLNQHDVVQSIPQEHQVQPDPRKPKLLSPPIPAEDDDLDSRLVDSDEAAEYDTDE